MTSRVETLLERMELVQAAAGIGVFDDDLKSDHIEWDERMCAIWGAGDCPQVPRDHFMQSIHLDDLHMVQARFEAACMPGSSGRFVCEYRIRRLDDGTLRHVACTGLVRFRDGKAVRLVGSARDVTEVRLAQKAAEENGRLVQALIDAAPAVLFAKDREGRYLMANSAALEAIGRPWEQVKGHADREWTPPEQLSLIEAIDRRVIEEARTIESEEPFHYDAEGPRIYLTRKTPLIGEDGSAFGLVGSAIDVTERLRATAAVAASETRLRHVLDQLFAFVGVLRPDGLLEWANRAPLALAGLGLPDVRGRLFWEAHWWSYSADAREKVRRSVERAAAGETSRFDIPALFTGPEPLMIDFQIAPLRDEDGRIINLIPSGMLIEDRVQAERARELLIEELHHRIKNLYSIAMGIVQQTASSAADPKDFARTAGARLAALATAHDLIRPSAAASTQPAQLRQLVDAIITPLAGGPTQLSVDGVPILLGRTAVTPMALVLHELGTNAAKYGALSSTHGRVSIGWWQDGDRFRLAWQESGGPPAGDMPKRQGFGSRLIRASVEGQLGGALKVDWVDEGCRVVIEAPVTALAR